MKTGANVAYCQRNIETKHIKRTCKIVFCLIYFFFIDQCF